MVAKAVLLLCLMVCASARPRRYNPLHADRHDDHDVRVPAWIKAEPSDLDRRYRARPIYDSEYPYDYEIDNEFDRESDSSDLDYQLEDLLERQEERKANREALYRLWQSELANENPSPSEKYGDLYDLDRALIYKLFAHKVDDSERNPVSIGIKLVDKSDDSEDDDSALEQNLKAHPDRNERQPTQPPATLSLEKAKELLDKLQTAEQMKSAEQKKSEKVPEIFVKADVEKSEDSSSQEKNGDSESSSSQDDSPINQDSGHSEDIQSENNSRDLEIELLKQENSLLIRAIQYAVNAPLEYIEPPAVIDKMRELIRRATLRQDAIDYMERQNSSDED